VSETERKYEMDGETKRQGDRVTERQRDRQSETETIDSEIGSGER
jgi:hypothetical protein